MSDSDHVWDKGTLHKTGIWSYYILSNYVGVFLCAVLMYSVYSNTRRTSTDIFVAGLCSGCLWMSITCGTQCLINVIHGRFYGGEAACQVEAIAHVSAILTQFFCVAGIAVRSYLLVVRKHDVAEKHARLIVVSIWVVCCLVTGFASLFSPIYLMSNGTYCFFGFSSFAIAGWLLPGLVIALGVMIVCYYRTWRFFKATSDARGTLAAMTPANGTEQRAQAEVVLKDLSHRQVARRSAWFVVILLFGWGSAAVTAIYELAVGEALEWMVTAVGVGGVSFSWWVPLTYAYTSEYHRGTMMRLFGWMFVPCGFVWKGRNFSQASKELTDLRLSEKRRPSVSGPTIESTTKGAEETSTVPPAQSKYTENRMAPPPTESPLPSRLGGEETRRDSLSRMEGHRSHPTSSSVDFASGASIEPAAPPALLPAYESSSIGPLPQQGKPEKEIFSVSQDPMFSIQVTLA